MKIIFGKKYENDIYISTLVQDLFFSRLIYFQVFRVCLVSIVRINKRSETIIIFYFINLSIK